MASHINHFLVDYENTQKIDFEKLVDPSIRLHLFLGENQTRVPVQMLKEVHRYADHITIVECAGSGKNALDFHIAFHAGQISRDCPTAFIHIISKDKGFDPLVKHLKSQKLLVARSDTFAEAPFFHQKDFKALSLNARVELAKQRLTDMAKTRPRKRKTLLSMLAATFSKQLEETEISAIISHLEKVQLVSFDSAEAVTYNL
ncbi:MAG: PIN domain-containing protein [Chthoniobacteraceae bacterium]